MYVKTGNISRYHFPSPEVRSNEILGFLGNFYGVEMEIESEASTIGLYPILIIGKFGYAKPKRSYLS